MEEKDLKRGAVWCIPLLSELCIKSGAHNKCETNICTKNINKLFGEIVAAEKKELVNSSCPVLQSIVDEDKGRGL